MVDLELTDKSIPKENRELLVEEGVELEEEWQRVSEWQAEWEAIELRYAISKSCR